MFACSYIWVILHNRPFRIKLEQSSAPFYVVTAFNYAYHTSNSLTPGWMLMLVLPPRLRTRPSAPWSWFRPAAPSSPPNQRRGWRGQKGRVAQWATGSSLAWQWPVSCFACGVLPWRPYGRVALLSVSTDRTTWLLNRSFRVTPSPPRYVPAPPEPVRRENSSKMTGYLNTRWTAATY